VDVRAIPMSEIADVLTRQLDEPVIDMTGINGFFTFSLIYSQDQAKDPGPSIFTALQEQLGLRLETRKVPVDVLVVITSREGPMRINRALCLLSFVSGTAFAQSFEAATIKPNDSGDPGAYTNSRPGEISLRNNPLQTIIQDAFNVRKFSFSGPAWLNTVRFDVHGKDPSGGIARTEWRKANLLNATPARVTRRNSLSRRPGGSPR
jgi:hypothetical protein